jgi:hypothetical protein
MHNTVFPDLIPHGELLFRTPRKGGELFRGGELLFETNFFEQSLMANVKNDAIFCDS